MLAASLLALSLIQAPSALAADDAATAPDPGLVLAVGGRAGATGALVGEGWIGVDATAQLSLEARIDTRTAFRIEAGGNPVRGRIHVAAAARAYPAGRGRAAWWAEMSGHVQRTSGRLDPDRWAPRPARAWVSLPFLVGGGWRIIGGENFVLDFGGHVGPMLEIRPQEAFPVGFGFAATGHVMVGTAF